MKYIPVDKLKKYVEHKREVVCDGLDWDDMDECHRYAVEYLDDILAFTASLQQDKDVLDLCSQVWWEDRGWMMIPPNITLKGLESLLERVRHKIKWNEENGIEEQEQPESELEKAARYVYESWMGGTMDDVRRDMVELGKVLNARGIKYE